MTQRDTDFYRNLAMQKGIPDYMSGAVARYIVNGISGGGFLTAVVENDLQGAVGRADDINLPIIQKYVRFFYNDAPSGCWGSPELVRVWIESGGLRGIEAKHSHTTEV